MLFTIYTKKHSHANSTQCAFLYICEKTLIMSYSEQIGNRSYRKIRNQCGILGMLLPWFALFSAGIAQHPGPDWWWSISATYYQSPALVAVLVPACLVLFNYIGYDPLDRIITNLSALFGLGIVLFPCKVGWIPDGTPVGFFQLPIQISNCFHLACAGLFFFLIAFNSLFLFTKSKEGVEPTPQKLVRNRIYRICGITTLILLALMGPAILGIIPCYFQMIFEILLLTVFGFAWLVKGDFFPCLRDKE